MTIADSLAELQRNISRKLQSLGRHSEDAELILVTKTVETARIQQAYDAGIRHMGENRIQEWLSKVYELPEAIHWHIIGHLQLNKVKYLIKFAAETGRLPLLHSMDREELAVEIDGQAKKKGLKEFPCLIQVNTSGEASKGGFTPETVIEFLKKMPGDSCLKFQGLMTIGPFVEDFDKIRESFRRLKMLRERLRKEFAGIAWKYLSMGMSADYEIALEEGSNMLRIGSIVFGSRPSKERV